VQVVSLHTITQAIQSDKTSRIVPWLGLSNDKLIDRAHGKGLLLSLCIKHSLQSTIAVTVRRLISAVAPAQDTG
jgi:hypothetical protein